MASARKGQAAPTSLETFGTPGLSQPPSGGRSRKSSFIWRRKRSFIHPMTIRPPRSDTNVMGLVRVLDAARAMPTVRAIVNVTSDKCYENREQLWAYRETEPMGGHDPYSASKGCAELVTASYRRSYFDKDGAAVLASGRAGNVIGGGDWAGDRLVPDCVRAFSRGETVLVRNPLATRPWQHVLEPICGYLVLAEALIARGREVAEGWNFGPSDDDAWPVGAIVDRLVHEWGGRAAWAPDPAVARKGGHAAKSGRNEGSRPAWLAASIGHRAGSEMGCRVVPRGRDWRLCNAGDAPSD